MDNEPYRDLGHDEAADLIKTMYLESPHNAWREFLLPNRRVADVLFINDRALITIVEVKTVLKQSLVSDAWEKYHMYCNHLYVAIPNLQIKTLAEVPFILEWSEENRRVGILAVYRDSLAVVRPALNRWVDPRFKQSVLRLIKTP